MKYTTLLYAVCAPILREVVRLEQPLSIHMVEGTSGRRKEGKIAATLGAVCCVSISINGV